MGSDGESEDRPVRTPLEPIQAAVLHFGPANGQLIDAADLIIDDGAVAQPRSNHAIAIGRQRSNQGVKPGEIDELCAAPRMYRFISHYEFPKNLANSIARNSP